MNSRSLRSFAACGLAAASLSAPAAGQSLIGTVQGTDGMFGSSVGVVGDVDGDGYDDYVVGSPWAASAGAPDHGKADVISGKTGEVIHTVVGLASGDRLGQSVAGAGFVDGDNVPDFIVGAVNPSFLTNRPGYAIVYSGADATPIHTIQSTAMFDNFGTSVAGAGDVDDDGFDDVIIGAPQLSAIVFGVGHADVYSGATGGLLFRLYGLTPLDAAGYSVGGAGDLNKDGNADVIVGAPQFFLNPGFAVVISGAEALDVVANQGSPDIFFDSAPNPADLALRIFTGSSFNGQFARSVSRAGDCDGDGFEDYAVGAPLEAGGKGRVTVYSGGTRTKIWSADGDVANGQLGTSVGGGADVTGDGIPDVVAGAWQAQVTGPSTKTHTGKGYARLFSGSDGTPHFTVFGPLASSEFGFSVHVGGDVNGDGTQDVLVGAPNDATAGNMAGSVWIYNAFVMLSMSR